MLTEELAGLASQYSHRKGIYNFTYTGIGTLIYFKPYTQVRYNEFESSSVLHLQGNITDFSVTGTQENTPIPYLGSGYSNMFSTGYQQLQMSLTIGAVQTNPFLAMHEVFVSEAIKISDGIKPRDLYNDDYQIDLLTNATINSNFDPLQGNIFDVIEIKTNQAGERTGSIIYECKMNGYIKTTGVEQESIYRCNYTAVYAILDMPIELIYKMFNHDDWNKLKMALIAFSNNQYFFQNKNVQNVLLL